jgi:hypothetical protein
VSQRSPKDSSNNLLHKVTEVEGLILEYKYIYIFYFAHTAGLIISLMIYTVVITLENIIKYLSAIYLYIQNTIFLKRKLQIFILYAICLPTYFKQ